MVTSSRRTATAATTPEAQATPARRVRPAQAQERGRVAAMASKVEEGRMVSSTSAYDQETTQTEVMTRTHFAPGQEPAFVRVGAGLTCNLGNFESLRIDVAVTLPCLITEIDATVALASDFVADRVAQEETAWLGGRAKPKASRRG